MFRTLTVAFAWASCAWLASSFPVLAEVPKNAPPEKDTLQAVLDRIQNHAAGDAWKQPGWKDDAIQSYLDKLIATIALATENKDLKLPVRMGDVKPFDPAPRNAFRPEGMLLIGKNLKITNAPQRSIILADGSVELMSIPQECIIVARHAIVGRSNLRSCVLVAGSYFCGQYDGMPDNPAAGSLIITRGRAEMTASWGSLIAAGENIQLGMCQNTIFLNSEIQGNDRGGSRSIRAANLLLAPPSPHPLCAKIEVTGVVTAPPPALAPGRNLPFGPEANRPGLVTGAVFRLDGRRHVADVGQPIVDDFGQPIESLRGWQLAFATDKIAIFRNADADAVVRIEGR